MIEKLIIAIIAVFAGAIFNQYRTQLIENANQIQNHIQDLEMFSEEVREYWLTAPKSFDEELKISARVKSYYAWLTPFYGEAGKRLSKKHLRQYHTLLHRLFKSSMGGQFETKNRNFDAPVAIESFQISSELVHLLRQSKREQLALTAPISGFWDWVTKK